MNLNDILDGSPEPAIVDLQLENPNNSGTYDLPTPVYEFQRELTDQIVSLHYSDILKYCETDDTKSLLKESLEICIRNCMHVSTHPYLLISHYMPKNLTQKDLPSKLAETSGKFDVLKDLIDVILQTNPKTKKNIGIVINNNTKYFDLVEALLLGSSGGKIIRRYLGNSIKKDSTKTSKNNESNKTSSLIHLLPFDGKFSKDENISSIKFDLLIVLDSWVDFEHEFFTQIRTQNRRNPAIVIRLVPMKTVEHCQLYYSGFKASSNYLYNLISGVVCLREQVGILPPDILPIYNQKLKYLQYRFFDHVFKNTGRSLAYPAWPLPELPKLRKFSANDVERSLLTEVHYHYTPYDSSDFKEEKEESSSKKSYYERKRLQLDYITNSLKNDYRVLTGIQGHSSDLNDLTAKKILTHLGLTQLEGSQKKWELIIHERESYDKHEKRLELQHLRVRSLRESKNVLSTFIDDITHAESRIMISEKKSKQGAEEVEELRKRISEIKSEIEKFREKDLAQNPMFQEFVKNQLEIWEMQSKIKDSVTKIQNKDEERIYMSKEVEAAETSQKESATEMSKLQESNNELSKKFDSQEQLYKVTEDYKRQKLALLKEIGNEKDKLASSRIKFERSLKFLTETSHLKKRRSRGVTPSVK